MAALAACFYGQAAPEGAIKWSVITPALAAARLFSGNAKQVFYLKI
jgi:hypothetical protein